MDITPLMPKDMLIIKGYGEGFFNVNGQRVFDNIIVFRDQLLSWDLEVPAIDIVLSLEIRPELVLFGLGHNTVKPDKLLINSFRNKNIAVEFMDSAAVCRTYNILLAEGREICAFLKR